MPDPQPMQVHITQAAAPRPPMRAPSLREDAPRVTLKLAFNEFGSKFLHVPSTHPGAETLIERDPKNPGAPFEVTVYADEVDAVEGMVETAVGSVLQARRSYEAKIREMVASACLESKDPRDLPADRKDWSDAMRRVEMGQGTVSVEGEFYSVERRGIRPLASCEMVGDLLAPFGELATAKQAEIARASAGEPMDLKALAVEIAAASAKATVEALIAAGVVKAPKGGKASEE